MAIPLVTVAVEDGVPRYVAEIVARMAHRVPRVTEIRHHVPICVVDQAAILADNGDRRFGEFLIGYGADTGMLAINLAGRFYRYGRTDGDDGELPMSWLRWHLRCILAHEFGHYEQFREGREPTERGVNRRAARLLRDLGYVEPADLAVAA